MQAYKKKKKHDQTINKTSYNNISGKKKKKERNDLFGCGQNLELISGVGTSKNNGPVPNGQGVISLRLAEHTNVLPSRGRVATVVRDAREVRKMRMVVATGRTRGTRTGEEVAFVGDVLHPGRRERRHRRGRRAGVAVEGVVAGRGREGGWWWVVAGGVGVGARWRVELLMVGRRRVDRRGTAFLVVGSVVVVVVVRVVATEWEVHGGRERGW